MDEEHPYILAKEGAKKLKELKSIESVYTEFTRAVRLPRRHEVNPIDYSVDGENGNSL
jgi:hypothetical protein